MRKRILTAVQQEPRANDQEWLDLETLADVEVTCEDLARPIEAALLPGESGGWIAGQPGKQTIRLCFKRPQTIHHIHLEFDEPGPAHTHEYVLRWLPEGEQATRDIVRQQFNFSPQGATVEIEDHRVELRDALVLELAITPDIADERAYASLAKLRIA